MIILNASTAEKCEWCGADEERVLIDSWTGKRLCLECVSCVAQFVTNSPATEGDNLKGVLNVKAGDRKAAATEIEVAP